MKTLIATILTLVLVSCSEKSSVSTDVYGVGPITEMHLEDINDSIMKIGMEHFKSKCTSCHTMEYKNSGPDISDILAIRKKEWLMNFMLNKEEMLQRDAFAIKTRKKYDVGCGLTNISKQEALELLEYFRIYQIWLHEFNAL